MSIAMKSNNGSGGAIIRRPRFAHGGGGGGGGVPCLSIYEDRRRLERDSDSCSSSSIGRNSDLSGSSSGGEGSGGDEEEVQSLFKGPLDTMAALEEALPIKSGMSKFYSGKSKSFTSLADAASISSIKDIAKPENPYNKKRKNSLSKPRHCSLQSIGAGTSSKRPANSGQGTFLGNCEEPSLVSASPPSCSLPPMHPRGRGSQPLGCSLPPQRQSPWRSFSLSDLQSVCASEPN